MANFKFVKSATAAVLGASVLTTAVVVPGADASAKTTYKVNKNGTLVNAKTNKAVKGYKTYKGKLYKNGKKFTGKTSSGVYYVKGKKFTGKTKYGYYYVNGKRFTGTTKYGYYYVNGKRFNGTTKYGNLYVDGKRYTGTTKYGYTYYNGKRVEGEYKGKVYTNGKLVTGLYKEKLYNKGVLETGLDLYQDKLYKDGVLNVGYALYNDKELYKDADKNVGWAINAIDGKTYFDTALANDTYTDANGVETAYEDGVEVGAKVKSVEAINGKQLKVTFNKTVEEDSVIEASGANKGTLVDGAFKFEKVAATSPAITLDSAEASLSKDGRTLTITYSGSQYAAGDYVFSVVKNKVQTTNKATVEYIPAYTSSTINVKDTVAPTLESTTKINATQYKLTFSKPVSGLGSISAKYTDGTDLGSATVTSAAASTDADNNAIIVTLTNTTVNKDVNVQIVGITDYNGNIVSPNPVTFTTNAGAKDGVAPTFTVTPESASSLTVKFSEEVQAFPKTAFKIDGTALTDLDKVVQDETDKTKYTVKLATPLTSGFHNIAVDATSFKDLSGEDNTAHASTIQIKADQVAPVLSSSKVVKERDGKEYLYVTFDKDVQLDGLNGALTGLTGKSVKNYVTDKTVKFNTTAAFTSVDGSKKEYKLDLASITTGTAPTTAALENGVTYTIDLPASVVKTLTGTPSVAQTGAITFTKGSDSSISSLEVAKVRTNQSGINDVADTTLANNQVTVEFDQPVDGATATTASNYVIDGASVTKAELGTDNKTVTLTLADDKTTYTGARYLTINNVKSSSGKALAETFKKAITLNENIAPTVTGAVIKSVDNSAKVATVELSFSEAITTADVNTLAVYVDGQVDAGVTVANVAATTSKTLTVNISLDNVSKLTNNTITLKANGTNNTIVDAAGNTASIGTVTVK